MNQSSRSLLSVATIRSEAISDMLKRDRGGREDRWVTDRGGQRPPSAASVVAGRKAYSKAEAQVVACPKANSRNMWFGSLLFYSGARLSAFSDCRNGN